jgi:protein TonB
MDNNSKKVPDFDDLLFETRNQEYGAYQLRKKYRSLVILGTLIASIIVSVSVIIPFVLTPHNDHVYSGGNRYVKVEMDNLEPPAEEIILPPSPPPPDSRMQEIVKYIPPVVVDSLPITERPTMTNDDILAQPTDLKPDITGTGMGDDFLTGREGNESDEPFIMVEIMPSFRGGDINKFREWVMKRTTYPQLALEKKIQGRVTLTFIVESDGSVSNVSVLKGVDPLIDNEAVKTIEASPRWSPGLQRGKPVRVRYQIGLNFMI